MLTLLLLILLSVAPLRLPFAGQVTPPLGLIAVYFWALNRPGLLPPSVVFVLGLLQDAIAGTPLGTSSLIFLLVHWATGSLRRYLAGADFLMKWGVFAVLSLIMPIIELMVFAFLVQGKLPVQAELYRLLLGWGLFPVVAGLILSVSARALPAPERSRA